MQIVGFPMVLPVVFDVRYRFHIHILLSYILKSDAPHACITKPACHDPKFVAFSYSFSIFKHIVEKETGKIPNTMDNPLSKVHVIEFLEFNERFLSTRTKADNKVYCYNLYHSIFKLCNKDDLV